MEGRDHELLRHCCLQYPDRCNILVDVAEGITQSNYAMRQADLDRLATPLGLFGLGMCHAVAILIVHFHPI